MPMPSARMRPAAISPSWCTAAGGTPERDDDDSDGDLHGSRRHSAPASRSTIEHLGRRSRSISPVQAGVGVLGRADERFAGNRRRPRFSSPSVFGGLPTGRGGWRLAIHCSTSATARAAAARISCQSSTTAAAPTRLESVAPFDRLDGVRRSLARSRHARRPSPRWLATTISPGRRQTTDAIRNRLPDPAPQPERNQAVRSSAARSARRRPRSPRPGWSPLSTGPVLRASIRCCPSISHGTPSTSWTTVRNRDRHEQNAAGIPTLEGTARGNCFN